MHEDEIPIGYAKNIAGQKFGLLTALYRVKNKGKKVQWKCLCQCGNLTIAMKDNLSSGHTTSCGCQRGIHIKDITNQRFGRLIAIKPIKQIASKWKWLCQCDCGTQCEVFSDYLIQGDTQSCGCLQEETRHNNVIPLQGKRFGKLTVLQEDHRANQKVYWKCLCDCGNNTVVTTGHLSSGHTQSCGCLLSKGELKIITLLQEYNIMFTTQKSFDTCRYDNSDRLPRFDFYVNNNFLIEFDGEQHYRAVNIFGGEEGFKLQQARDKYKNQWCKDNNIPLIRIPYTKLNTLCIEDLLLETTQFRVV